MEWIVVGLIVLLCLAVAGQLWHRQELRRRYAGSPYQEDILAGRIRVGMTTQELFDSWGPPEATDVRVLKTKVVHTYKYARTGARSFRQRVKVEDGVVVGWSQT